MFFFICFLLLGNCVLFINYGKCEWLILFVSKFKWFLSLIFVVLGVWVVIIVLKYCWVSCLRFILIFLVDIVVDIRSDNVRSIFFFIRNFVLFILYILFLIYEF